MPLMLGLYLYRKYTPFNRLRRCISGLTVSHAKFISTLLDALLGMLSLVLVYVRRSLRLPLGTALIRGSFDERRSCQEVVCCFVVCKFVDLLQLVGASGFEPSNDGQSQGPHTDRQSRNQSLSSAGPARSEITANYGRVRKIGRPSLWSYWGR